MRVIIPKAGVMKNTIVKAETLKVRIANGRPSHTAQLMNSGMAARGSW
jgi:hypothetical protein